MTPTTPATAPAQDSHDLAVAAYEPLARYYDLFTERAAYEPVIAQVEAWAQAQGLRGRRLLDVACGTGKSFVPMVERGYELTACDISPAMVAEACTKAPAAEIVVADMRSLPWRARFDLVTCMDDAVNYLLTAADLHAAIASMAGALAPDGILIFDANTLGTYRGDFAESFEIEAGDTRFQWQGEASPDVEPGAVVSATMTIHAPGATVESRHVQRHWPVEALREACLEAGLGQVVFRGLVTGPRLAGDPDEGHDLKVVCLATRATTRGR
jgi:SAM-dependent methyltransferase